MPPSPTDRSEPTVTYRELLRVLHRRSRIAVAVLWIVAALTLLLLVYNVVLLFGFAPQALGQALPPDSPHRWSFGSMSCTVRVRAHTPDVKAWGLTLPIGVVAVWAWAVQASRLLGPLSDPSPGQEPPARFSRGNLILLAVPVVSVFVFIHYVKVLWRHSHPGEGLGELTALPLALCATHVGVVLVTSGEPHTAIGTSVLYLALALATLVLGIRFIQHVDHRLRQRLRRQLRRRRAAASA